MAKPEPFGHRLRILAAVVLVCGLVGLMVWYGTLPGYDQAMNDYPDEGQVGHDPDAYVGQSVSLGGTVVETDPVVIALDHPSERRVTIENADRTLHGGGSLDDGDSVTAFGTLTTTEMLEADRTLTREPWELYYMYAISFIGGLWALGRFVRGWTFDRARLAFVPRDRLDKNIHSESATSPSIGKNPDRSTAPPTVQQDTPEGDR